MCMKLSKENIYLKYGIRFVRSDSQEHIITPEFGEMPKLLVNGNTKLGKDIYQFSMLPTTKFFTAIINGKEYGEFGTCPCDCTGCYATKGNYKYSSTIKWLVYRTYLVRHYIDFVERAIMAQIEADKVEFIRIHAAGDFFSMKEEALVWEYVAMWKRIAKAFPAVIMWTYTKNREVETAFDDIENVNIVPSIIAGYGFNFGHIGYILELYHVLKEAGKKVYICRCGIDKNQHCTNCKACSECDYVLFIEHSTEYKAEKDPLYQLAKETIEAQGNIYLF